MTIPGAIVDAPPVAAGAFAPVDASYVVVGLNAVLTQERVLTAGTGIAIVDGGAGGNITVSATSDAGPWETTGTDVHLDVTTQDVTVGALPSLAKFTVRQEVETGGSPSAMVLVGGAHTTLVASVEAIDVDFDLARTVQFATGALATQRAVLFQAPTYAFVAASTITTAATVAITGAPIEGANATITNSFALDVTGDTRITGKLTVTGAIDPTSVALTTGTALFFESDDGNTAPVSGAATGRLRYDDGAAAWQISVQTGAYVDILTGAVGSTAFLQDGNSFGALATLGTNDAQALAFETSGVERVRIPTGGPNLLIGATVALAAANDAIQVDRTFNGTFNGIRARNLDGGASALCELITDSNVGQRSQIGITSNANVGVLGANQGFLQTTAGNGWLIITTAAAPIKFRTTSLDRMRILAASNTLQGTAGLTIEGGAAAGNDLTLSSTANATKGSLFFGTSAYDEVNNRLGIGVAAPTSDLHVVQPIATSGSPTMLLFTSGAHTTLAASTEAITANFDFSATVEFATGALATQRTVLIQGATYAFVAASTLTTATTLEVEAPIAGANATFTNTFAARFTGNVEVTGKLTVGGLIDPTGITMSEQAADPGATGAGFGTYWVINTAPTRPRFTDDTGTDRNIVTTPAAALLTQDQVLVADANGYITDAGTTDIRAVVGATEMCRITAAGMRVEVGGISGNPDAPIHVLNTVTDVLLLLEIQGGGVPGQDFFRDDATPTNGDQLADVRFFGRDSALNADEFAGIDVFADTVTTTLEEGSLRTFVVTAGVLTEITRLTGTGLRIQPAGVAAAAGNVLQTFGDTVQFNHDAAVVLQLNRASASSAAFLELFNTENPGAAGYGARLNFFLRDDGGGKTEFGRLTTEIKTATAASEDGEMQFHVMNGGTITEIQRLDDVGLRIEPGGISGAPTAALQVIGAIIATTVDATTDFTVGATVITDGVITDAGGLQIAAAVDMANNTISNIGAATNDWTATGITTAGSVAIGVAGSDQGTLTLAGVTSGVVTVAVAAVAGTWTMTLPAAVAAVGGEQLTDAAGNGVTSWAAAASSREFKNIHGEANPQDALGLMLRTKAYQFHYKDGYGTHDYKTEYVGPVAEEAAWAMHYGARIVNPVNTLGYMLLGFQAQETQLAENRTEIQRLKDRIAALEAA